MPDCLQAEKAAFIEPFSYKLSISGWCMFLVRGIPVILSILKCLPCKIKRLNSESSHKLFGGYIFISFAADWPGMNNIVLFSNFMLFE